MQVVCRDGFGAYAEAVHCALPDAVQVAGRWHLWQGLVEVVLTEVAAHSACWGKPAHHHARVNAPPRPVNAGGRCMIYSIAALACSRSPAG